MVLALTFGAVVAAWAVLLWIAREGNTVVVEPPLVSEQLLAAMRRLQEAMMELNAPALKAVAAFERLRDAFAQPEMQEFVRRLGAGRWD